MGFLDYFKTKNKTFDVNEFLDQKDEFLDKLADVIEANLKLSKELEETKKAHAEALEDIDIILEFRDDIKRDMGIDPEEVVEIKVPPKQNQKLVDEFRKTLESQSGQCRGGCHVKDPGSTQVRTEMFYSRKEAEDLLEKFENKTLILVG